MKKLLTTALFAVAMVAISFAGDKIFLHGGKTIDGKVVKVDDFKIIFKYEGEEAEQTLTKKSVEKIQYSSGRTEEISEKITSKEKVISSVIYVEYNSRTGASDTCIVK